MTTHPILATSILSGQQIYLLLIVGLIGCYMLWSAQRKMRNRANSPLDRPEPAEARAGADADYRQDADRLMVELNEFARQVNAQIDTRTAKLEALIRHADQRLEQLRQGSRELEGHAPSWPTKPTGFLESVATPASATRLRAGDGSSLHRRVVALSAAGSNTQQIAQILKITPSEVELVLALNRCPANLHVYTQLTDSRDCVIRIRNGCRRKAAT